jgi:hypothetical protein
MRRGTWLVLLRRGAWLVPLGLGACLPAGPQRWSVPAPADPTELYFCVLNQVTSLGYRVRHAERSSGLIQAQSLTPQGKNAQYEPLYNEITVTVSHDPAGDTMHVTATDRRHGEAIVQRCAAPR